MVYVMKITDVILPEDITLDEELSALTEEELFEMANLSSDQTGILGTLNILSEVGQHGPRVKYFIKPGRNQPSFSVSVSSDPIMVANSLEPRFAAQLSKDVIAWTRTNHEALLDFWKNGDGWSHHEVADFISSLRKIS